jgi:hypothetical protein
MDAAAPRWSTLRNANLLMTGLLVALLAAPAGWFVWRDRQLGEIGSNERTAMSVLKFLAACEAEYRARDLDGNGVRDFWTGDVAALLTALPPGTFGGGLNAQLYGSAMADRAALSRADPSHADAQPYRGYWFVPLETDGAVGRRHPTAFAFGAYPARVGRTGRSVFINNEQNSVFVRSNRDDPGPPRAWPGGDLLRKQWAMPQ